MIIVINIIICCKKAIINPVFFFEAFGEWRNKHRMVATSDRDFKYHQAIHTRYPFTTK